MSEKPTVYLAGPVQHADDGGEGWRTAIEDTVTNINWRNPLAKYNVPADGINIISEKTDAPDTVTPADIVNADKELLRDSEAVLVGYSDVKQVGTPMEVMFAYEQSIPCVIWLRNATDRASRSPWYLYHADIISDRRDAASACFRGE